MSSILEHEKETGLNGLTYNKTIVDLIKTEEFPEKIPFCSTEEITQLCIALAQYMSFLIYKTNQDRINYMESNKVFNNRKREVMVTYQLKARSNEELLAQIISKEPEITKLEDIVLTTESKWHLSEGMPDAIKEIINTLKKELDRRHYERQFRTS